MTAPQFAVIISDGRGYDGDGMCDSCTCCTAQDCRPAKCGEDDYGRFHCPCTSE